MPIIIKYMLLKCQINKYKYNNTNNTYSTYLCLFVCLILFLEKLLCREWLHKLFKATTHEESLRNAYLIKLLDQLEKGGKLNEPFNNLPKHNSPLLPLTTHNIPKQVRILYWLFD
jgi:hypothetical protein